MTDIIVERKLLDRYYMMCTRVNTYENLLGVGVYQSQDDTRWIHIGRTDITMNNKR